MGRVGHPPNTIPTRLASAWRSHLADGGRARAMLLEWAMENEPGFEGGEKSPPLRSQSEVTLPPEVPWPEPVDGQALLGEILAYLRSFVVFPRWAAPTVVLWIVHTFAFELRRITTYVGLESPEAEC